MLGGGGGRESVSGRVRERRVADRGNGSVGETERGMQERESGKGCFLAIAFSRTIHSSSNYES